MMKAQQSLLSVVFGVALALPAFAQTAVPQTAPPTQEESKTMPPAAQDPAFARLDGDGDGRISPIEADKDSAFGLKFDDLDTDDDGMVTAAEFGGTAGSAAPATAQPAAASTDAFSSLDADKDGRVSSTEASANSGFDASFSSIDANADGFVTSAEYTAHADTNKQP